MRTPFKWFPARRQTRRNRISTGSANKLRVVIEIGWGGCVRKGVFAAWTMSNDRGRIRALGSYKRGWMARLWTFVNTTDEGPGEYFTIGVGQTDKKYRPLARLITAKLPNPRFFTIRCENVTFFDIAFTTSKHFALFATPTPCLFSY